VEVWETSSLQPLRIGEEKEDERKKDERKKEEKNTAAILACPIGRP